MHCNHLLSPGLCKFFEPGMDRANEIQVVGNANVKRACKAAESVEVGRTYQDANQFLVLGPGEKPCRARWLKSSEQHGKLSTAEVLRLRAPSAVSPDPPVRRFAQDDGFVGGLEYNWLNMQKTRKIEKVTALSGALCRSIANRELCGAESKSLSRA